MDETSTEREYYCNNCKDFRDATENQGDIVCDKCAWVIATFQERQVITQA